MTQEKMTWIKRIGALALLTISLIMIIVTFVAGDGGIVGQWTVADPTEQQGFVEFSGNGSFFAVSYSRGSSNAKTLQGFYTQNGNFLTLISYDGENAQMFMSRNGNMMTLNGILFQKTAGGGFMWGLLIVALLLAGGAFALYFTPVMDIVLEKIQAGKAPAAAPVIPEIPVMPEPTAAPVERPSDDNL